MICKALVKKYSIKKFFYDFKALKLHLKRSSSSLHQVKTIIQAKTIIRELQRIPQ